MPRSRTQCVLAQVQERQFSLILYGVLQGGSENLIVFLALALKNLYSLLSWKWGFFGRNWIFLLEKPGKGVANYVIEESSRPNSLVFQSMKSDLCTIFSMLNTALENL